MIVNYCLKSIEYRKDLNSPDNDYRCGLALILLAFHRSEIANIEQDNPDCDVETLRRTAAEACDEAEGKFRKLNDMGHVAECLMTKALSDR